MKNGNCDYRFGGTVWLSCAALICLVGWGTLSSGVSDSGDTLLGLGPAQVIERLGAPESIMSGAAGYAFLYPSKSGEAEETVYFQDDCAFWVKPGFENTADPMPAPSSGVYPGQPIREAVERLGSPKEINQGANSISLEYESGMKVLIAHGLIVGVDE
jgi:hypothetical protein